MKKIIIASGVLALMAAATSCDKYDIYPEQYGKVLMIKDAGEKTVDLYSTDAESPQYVSVMKGGHDAEGASQATVGIMSDEQFKNYKANMYGDPDFPGLQRIPDNLYYLADAQGNRLEGTTLSHNFSGKDSYFGVNVVLLSSKIDEWMATLDEATTAGADFVVPVGLTSSTDSVNADNNAIMFKANMHDPQLQVSVANNNFQIQQLSRTALVSQTQKNFTPEVKLSIPCQNPYGFKVYFTAESDYVSDYNEAHKNQAPYSTMVNRPNQGIEIYNFKNAEGVDMAPAVEGKRGYFAVEFPANVTEITFPINILPDNINYNDISHTFVRGFRLEKAVPGGSDFLWNDNTPADANIRTKLTLPAGEGNKGYTFFIGYKVVETPLTLSDGLVTSNDCEPTEGSIAALFDSDLSTFFHSGWTKAFDRGPDFGSYLEIDCTTFEQMNACYFQITARNNANPAAPGKVKVVYSNEADAEARENAKAWTTFVNGEVTLSKLGSSEVAEVGSIDKPMHTTDWAPFKYVRFCAMTNSSGGSLTSPSTSVYWNLAEFVMYGKFIEEADRN